jgi:hypothetical protein
VNLLDADALSKLAHWDMLGELPSLTGFANAQTATLSSLVHRAAKGREKPDGKLFRDTVSAARAHEFLKQVAPLPMPDEQFIDVIQQIPAIDPGEALLFATLRAHQKTLLITGDKRAVTAIKGVGDSDVTASFSGRVVIVEQILLALLKAKGIDWLRNHVCPYRTLDKAIGIVMGSNCTAPEESVEMGLRSYITDIGSSTGELLCSTPPFWRNSNARQP